MPQAANSIAKTAAARREQIICPNCEKPYQIGAGVLGRAGRQVRCKSCDSVWFEPPIDAQRVERGDNPVLGAHFPQRMKAYLNGLPATVKRSSPKSTHVIKTFLIREGIGNGAVGYANGIKVDLQRFKNVEFLWDVVAKIESRSHPGEDHDLTFVAESENQVQIEKILEDANKLPIVRADARLMFFRANDSNQRNYFFERLRGLFERHRKTEPGDIYFMVGMEMQNLTYAVRKLTIPHEGSNVPPVEEF